MTIETSEMLWHAILFITPGFISYYIFTNLVPRKEEGKDSPLSKFLAFSCFNFVIWGWLLIVMNIKLFFTSNFFLAIISWFVLMLISPIAVGFLTGIFVQKNMFGEIGRKFKFSVIHPIPTAWDYVFMNQPSKWVLVTLKDGSNFAGRIEYSSFMSSDPDERDIYIEKVYSLDNEEKWTKIENSRGILIVSSEIKHIEFMSSEPEESNAKKNQR